MAKKKKAGKKLTEAVKKSIERGNALAKAQQPMPKTKIEQAFLNKTYEIGQQDKVCVREQKKLTRLQNEGNELFKEMTQG